MRILVAGDSYFPSRTFAEGLAPLAVEHELSFIDVDAARTLVPRSNSERRIREFEGDPEQLVQALRDHDVLVVHGAPVTDRVLDASPRLGLVCCARGGPLNVDVVAASERDIPVVTTPGKNADAVADLTVAFIVLLARRIPTALRFIDRGGDPGRSAFEGAGFFGRDLESLTLGLVGFGHVGRRVARRALCYGMRLFAYDPFVTPAEIIASGAEPRDLDSLIADSDVVSLHARATTENRGLFDARAFARMRRGALFINTARETLVDEDALYEALASGHLGGAALDVINPRNDASRSPFLDLENVVITPHIGGATHDTLLRGAQMIAAEIARFAAGSPLQNVARPYGPVPEGSDSELHVSD